MLLKAQHILPITSAPLENGAVVVRDDKILDLGPLEDMLVRYPDEEVADYGSAVLMPGFVDAFTHLEHSVLRGVIKDLPFAQWTAATSDATHRLQANDWYESAVLGGLEAISGGITCVADATSTGAVCTAVQRLGLRAIIFREVSAMDKERTERVLRSAQLDIRTWETQVDACRVSFGLMCGSLYSCHPVMMQRAAQLCRKDNLPLALYLAGSKEEVNFIRYGSSAFKVHSEVQRRDMVDMPPWLPAGTTPARYALNWGAFDAPKVVAVHCVYINDEDLKKLKERDVSVALCSRANAQLGMGVAPLGEFLKAGLRVGLATDSPAAADSIDMFIEMRIGMLMQRAVNHGEFMDAKTMVDAATIGAARVLHLEDKIGSLEVGKCADIIAVDLSGKNLVSGADVPSVLVNSCSGNDVIMTMINGKKVYEKDKWNVDVQIARNIARIIGIRNRLKA